MPSGSWFRRCGGFANDLDAHQLRHHRLAQIGEQRLEQLEGLGLVFLQRIALRVAAETDDRAQVVEVDQMLAPEMVKRLKHNRFFHIAS
jgi:hypothetical protein